MLKSLVKIVLVLAVLYAAVDYFYLSGWETDISNEPVIKPWINKEFECLEEIFLHRNEDDSRDYYLCTYKDLDSEVVEFMDNQNRSPRGKPYGYWQDESIGEVYALPPGTKFRITRVFLFEQPFVTSFFGPMLNIQVKLANHKGNKRVLADFVFKKENTPPAILGPVPNLIKQCS